MKIAKIQFAPWDKVYHFDANGLDIKVGDKVIVKTDLGKEIGEVIGLCNPENSECIKCHESKASELPVAGVSQGDANQESQDDKTTKEIKPIIRKATSVDLESRVSEEEIRKAFDFCKKMIDKHKLEMKLVDVNFSFDRSRVTFAFIADGRVDFRELVKDLTRNFNKSIRLHQIGIRDEARIMGDCGHCGRDLCCKKHLKDLASITSEMAEAQQVVHRGSERISGICGRLMCCLAYEQAGYEESQKKLPPIGAKVNVDGQRGVVIGHHVLKESVDVEFPSANEKERNQRVEVDLNRHKK